MLQKYPRFHPGGDSQLRLKPVKRPKVVILVGPEPAQCRGRRILGRALNPAAYSGDSTGDRETDSSVLFFIIFNCLIISSAFAFTTPFSHTMHTVPIKPTMVVALLPVFHSNLVVDYITIVTHSVIRISTSFGPLSGETEKSI